MYKKIINNAGYLFLAQGTNYIFPIITLPYLTLTLGIKGFGIYAFAQVVVQYIQIITDYGFNLTATRKLASLQNNKEKIGEIFWSVLAIKIFLGIIVTIIGAVILFFLVADHAIQWLYIYSFSAVWGSILFPVWYFQGIESMRKIAWINILGKMAGLLILFFTVHDAGDTPFAGFAQAFPIIFSAVIACFVIHRSKKVPKINIKWQEIKMELTEGWHIFLSSVFSAMSTNSGTFILGLYSNAEIVGVYASSERIVKAAVGFFAPITQAIYPSNAKAFSHSIRDGFDAVEVTSFYLILLAALASLSLWVSAPYIALLFDWKDEQHVYVMRLLVPWLFLGIVNNVLGIQILAALGAGAIYSRLFMFAATGSVLTLLLGVRKYDIDAVLLSMNLAEIILTILLIGAVRIKWKLK